MIEMAEWEMIESQRADCERQIGRLQNQLVRMHNVHTSDVVVSSIEDSLAAYELRRAQFITELEVYH